MNKEQIINREKITFDSDRPMTVNGVPGRLTHRTVKPGAAPGLWTRQRWISEARPIPGYDKGATLRAEIRFDDEYGNGHNTFAITAEVRVPRRRDIEAGGCLHDDIARVFPELASLIKWHLVSTDGPMHYVANTVYHASDRDFDAARSCGVWPDATDEELSADPETLKVALLERLPGLLAEFRADVERAGFLWSPEDFSPVSAQEAPK